MPRPTGRRRVDRSAIEDQGKKTDGWLPPVEEPTSHRGRAGELAEQIRADVDAHKAEFVDAYERLEPRREELRARTRAMQQRLDYVEITSWASDAQVTEAAVQIRIQLSNIGLELENVGEEERNEAFARIGQVDTELTVFEQSMEIPIETAASLRRYIDGVTTDVRNYRRAPRNVVPHLPPQMDTVPDPSIGRLPVMKSRREYEAANREMERHRYEQMKRAETIDREKFHFEQMKMQRLSMMPHKRRPWL